MARVTTTPFSYFAHWWAWMLRGVLALGFGVFAFFLPGVTLALLVLVFGVWAFVDGVMHVSLALSVGVVHPWLHGLEGLIGMAVGVLAFFYPLATIVALVYVIAIWAILTGASRVMLSFRLRRTPSREWMIGLSGALAMFFGFLLLWAPEVGAIAISYWLGAYAIIAGLVFVGLALRMRGAHRMMSQEL